MTRFETGTIRRCDALTRFGLAACSSVTGSGTHDVAQDCASSLRSTVDPSTTSSLDAVEARILQSGH